MPPELMQNPYGRLQYGQQAMNMYTQNQPLPPGQCVIYIYSIFSSSMTHKHKKTFGSVVHLLGFSTGGPGLEPPYRPTRNPQMNKMMPTRPSYPGMMPSMQGSMTGMMGMDKQYPMGYKPQPNIVPGQTMRQHLQVRLVSQSAVTCLTAAWP